MKRRFEEGVNAIFREDYERLDRVNEEIAEDRLMLGEEMLSAEDVASAFNQRVKEKGLAIPFGIAPLDSALGGKPKRNLMVVAARPSMGKSSLIIQLARNDAQRCKTGLFSPEMGREDIWQRIACPIVGIDWQDVIGEKITEEQEQKLVEASSKMAERLSKLYIDDTPGITTSEIHRKAIAMGLESVYVDHLGELGDPGDKEHLRRGNMCSALKGMAKSLDIPVVLVAQLNRSVEMRKDKTPQLADLRESGHIEQIADSVLMLYREAYYDENDDSPITDVWVRKFRNGLRNQLIQLEFDTSRQWFTRINEPVPHWADEL